jgi:hypothetical protein
MKGRWASRQRKGGQICLLVALLLLNSSPAVVAKQFFGLGGESCGAWLEMRRDKLSVRLLGMEAWGSGYLTAMNEVERKDILLNINAEATHTWIDNYCSAHPLDTLNSAYYALTQELKVRAK